MLLYLLIGMLTALAKFSWNQPWWRVLSGTIQYVPAFLVTPHLVLRLRRLHARDVRSRRGEDIDTAFGLTSMPVYGAVTTGITLVNVVQDEGEEPGGEALGEEIPMDEREVRSACSSDA